MKQKINKKIVKIIYVLIMILVILLSIIRPVFGKGIQTPDDMYSIYKQNDQTISNIGGKVIWVVQVIFYAAAVIILMIAGLSYMFAAPEGKAEIKKKMIYLAIGSIVLFAAGGITQIIANLALGNIKPN